MPYASVPTRKRARCPTPPPAITVGAERAVPARLRRTPPELPDEVLVAVLRLVRSAGVLWKMRAVCKRWRRVIDAHPDVWRTASFRGALLPRPVILRKRTRTLELGARRGHGAVAAAAAAGNDWARFLESCLYNASPLKALTVAQPVASALVHGVCRFETREPPPSTTHGWVAVHAARRGPQHMPRGALVGMIRVAESFQRPGGLWSWRLERNMPLKNPLRCAGYVGLWSLSPHLTEVLVRALHTQ